MFMLEMCFILNSSENFKGNKRVKNKYLHLLYELNYWVASCVHAQFYNYESFNISVKSFAK